MIKITALPILMFLLCFNHVKAQGDSSKSTLDSTNSLQAVCFKFLSEQNWDSALRYALIMEPRIKKEKGELVERYAIAVYLVGELYRILENYPEAYSYFKHSFSIYQKIYPNIVVLESYGDAVSRLGFTCLDLGAKAEAEGYFVKAAEIYKSINRMDNYAQVNTQIAFLYMDRGEYTKAEAIEFKMKSILDTFNHGSVAKYLMIAVYNNLAVLYSETDNIEKALLYLKKSVATLKKKAQVEKDEDETFIRSDCVQLLLNLAEAYAFNGHIDSAWLVCREAEDSLHDANNKLLHAQILKEKAFIYQQENKLKESITLYKQFVDEALALPVKPNDFDATVVNLGLLYTASKQYNLADSLFRRLITKVHEDGIEYSYLMQESEVGLCSNLVEMKKYDEAFDSLINFCHIMLAGLKNNFSGMSEAEQLKYKKGLDEVFDLIYTCLKNKTTGKNLLNEIFNLELQRKNIILTSQARLLNNARNSSDSAFQKLYGAWLNNRQIISKQYSLSYKQRVFNIDSLQEVNETLEKKVSSKGFTQDITGKDLLFKTLVAKQLPGYAYIEFVRYNYKVPGIHVAIPRYAAFILNPPDSVPAFVELCSEKELMQLMKNKRGEWIDDNQVTAKIYGSTTSEAGLLYNYIWKPMQNILRGAASINYSSAGLLNNISFPAIYNGKNYLINNYTFHRFYNLQDAVNDKDADSLPQNLSIWGSMNYNKATYSENDSLLTFSPPPQGSSFFVPTGITASAYSKHLSKEPLQSFATKETQTLKQIFLNKKIMVSSYENSNATEENFKQQAAGINGILHISTHGFYSPLRKENSKALLPGNFMSGNENPLFRCGIAFSGVNYYWLKGVPKNNHDDGILTGYEVAQLNLHHVQLVTLSACETGLGDVTANEGNLGLQRAFKLAGAKALLVSLWQVPARQTAELLSLFYTNWLNGKTLSGALQNAEQIMQKKYPPYFWAGFVLIE